MPRCGTGEIAAAFDVNGVRRGVLSAVSARPDFFVPRDLQFLEAVARWMGMLTRRVEMTELARKLEAERARHAAADEIITVLAHDLRNHINPLHGRLQLMRLRVQSGESISPPQIDAALRSVRRLSQLTNDLLDLKRLDEGLFSLSLTPVDLTTLARETAESLSTPSVPVKVYAEESVVVIADIDRMHQALENLVANAIKHSPPNQPVVINVSSSGPSVRTCGVLEVVDRGPGIAPELLPNLFNRFARGPNSTGLGLGLYMAQHIARAHAGELIAESKPGEGARMRLVIPIDTAQPQATQ